MECVTAREHLSAALDGELDATRARLLGAHLDRCPECRRWREAAHELTRRARLNLVSDVPQPDPALPSALAAARHEHDRARTPRLARAGLVMLAVAQLAIALPALVFGTDHDAPIHVAHEMGSFDLSIAVGFVVAAWRPELARGMRVLVGVAAVLLIVTALADLLAGRTTLLDEAPHLVTLLGWLLLEALVRSAPESISIRLVPAAGRPARAATPPLTPASGFVRRADPEREASDPGSTRRAV